MNAPGREGLPPTSATRGDNLGALLRAPAPGIATLPESKLAATELPAEEARVPEVQEEARYRFAQILEHLPKDLVPYVEYELQEIQNGKLPEGENSILRLNELEVILYAESLPKHDIRLIIAGIRHRARAAQKVSEEKARQSRKEDRAAAKAAKK